MNHRTSQIGNGFIGSRSPQYCLHLLLKNLRQTIYSFQPDALLYISPETVVHLTLILKVALVMNSQSEIGSSEIFTSPLLCRIAQVPPLQLLTLDTTVEKTSGS